MPRNFVIKSINKKIYPDITEAHVIKLLHTVDVGLCVGVGNSEPGQMCIEAAVNYSLGGDSGSDNPPCVFRDLRELKIDINDNFYWKNDKKRAQGLRRLGVAQLGTIDTLSREKFEIGVGDVFAREWLPYILRKMLPLVKKLPMDYGYKDYKGGVEKFRTGVISDITTLLAKIANPTAHNFKARMIDLINDTDKIAYNFSMGGLLSCMSEIYEIYYNEGDVGEVYARYAALRGYSPEQSYAMSSKICEKLVQLLIKLKTPGSKFLYLTAQKLPKAALTVE